MTLDRMASFRVRGDVQEELRVLAGRLGIPVSELLRQAVLALIEPDEEHEQRRPEVVRGVRPRPSPFFQRTSTAV